MKAEEAASKLLDGLEELNGAISGYTDAKDTLEEAGRQLIPLANAITNSVGHTTEVIAAIEAIGTPELLSELHDIEKANVASLESLGQFRTDLQASIATLGDTIGTSVASAESLAQLRCDLEDRITTLNDTMDTRHTELTRQGQQLSTQLRRSHTQSSLGFVLLAALSGISLYILFYYRPV